MAAASGVRLGSAPPFVGRDELVSTVVRVLGEPGAFLLVEGEAGIGKTRLLRKCLDAAELREHEVVIAACLPVEEPCPLGPVVDGIRRCRRGIAGVRLSPLAGALRPLFPEWAADLPPQPESLDDPLATRHRLFAALTEVIERLGMNVLVVEDAHWADSVTLEWLLTLYGRSLSLVVTYRPLEVPAGSMLRRLMSWRPVGATPARLSLGPFTPTQTGELVAAMAGIERVSQEFVQSLHEHTDGLPLAVVETVLLWRDRHGAIPQGDEWSRGVLQELQVPPTVRDSVLERLDRLDLDATAVLRAATVLGAPATAALLAEVAGLAEMVGVDGALASGLLQDSGSDRFKFRHALDAKTVGESIPAPQRRRLHQRAAHALQRLNPPPVARLTRHFHEAGDITNWSRYAQKSAELAKDSGDDRTAITVLHELLTTVELPVPEQVLVAHKLGETAALGSVTLGDLGPRVVQSLRDVLATDDLAPSDRGEIGFLLGKVLRQERQLQAAATEIEAAIPDLDHSPSQAGRAMLVLAGMVHPDWPVERHLEWINRATELQANAASPMDLGFTINRASVLTMYGEEDGWRVAGELLPRSAPGLRERRMLAGWLLNSARVAMLWGQFDRAREYLDRALTQLQDTGHHRGMTTARSTALALDWYTGAWHDIAESAAQLCESTDTPAPTLRSVRWIQGLLHLARAARADASRQLASLNAELSSESPFDPFAVPSAGLARLRLAEDAAAEAVAVTAPDIDLIERKGIWLWATDLAPVHVEALVTIGRLDRADELVGQFGRWARDRHVPAAAAALWTCRAVLSEGRSDHHAAAALFAEAAQAWAALPRPYDELLAMERRGRCLLAAGERDDALAVLSDAQARLRQLGARWDADRVALVLRQNGKEVPVASRRGRRGYGDELSPRELEVVALVTRGLTNRQIGKALFVSPKTIELHVGSAMRKLKVTSRTMLAVAAKETGLVAPEPEGC
jgi:DNA-binding CsgD family transcriptional regulator